MDPTQVGIGERVFAVRLRSLREPFTPYMRVWLFEKAGTPNLGGLGHRFFFFCDIEGISFSLSHVV